MHNIRVHVCLRARDPHPHRIWSNLQQLCESALTLTVDPVAVVASTTLALEATVGVDTVSVHVTVVGLHDALVDVRAVVDAVTAEASVTFAQTAAVAVCIIVTHRR